ncbi:hypothetical protein [Devosia sp.]|uniref:hypothetical protein n=1 Tax=Devosia sp. TaxID=1871048 RepID=UPI00260E3554|nr:hypothetical protein [Devosia sp.]
MPKAYCRRLQLRRLMVRAAFIAATIDDLIGGTSKRAPPANTNVAVALLLRKRWGLCRLLHPQCWLQSAHPALQRSRTGSRHILDGLLALLEPEFILAIGRDAQLALGELGIASEPVRHPSYGGQPEFVRDVSRHYGLGSANAQQSFAF